MLHALPQSVQVNTTIVLYEPFHAGFMFTRNNLMPAIKACEEIKKPLADTR
jgi:hypothetical protein